MTIADPVGTRDRLVVAAAHLFARHGIEEVPLRDVAALAGQRNASAVQYHFNGRWDLVAAILARHDDSVRAWAPPIEERSMPEIVAGLVELLRSELPSTEGRDYLRVVFELIARYPGRRWSADAATHPGFGRLVTRLVTLLDDLPDEIAEVRALAMAQFVSYQMAERSRLVDESDTQLLDEDVFLANLISMSTALLTAPFVPPTAKPTGKQAATARRRRPSMSTQGRGQPR